jgi:cytochrome P450
VESLVREFCSGELDPLIGSGGFDFIADLGAMMPMRTIGYLLGIPEDHQAGIRDRNSAFNDTAKRREPGEVSQKIFEETILMFAEFIEWRADHPSDDLMTELLAAEIDEPDGTRRPLSRTEVLSYTAMIAGAGNETTTRLIGFMGQLLSDHPDQRRELADDPSLIPGAVEETLRYEPPSPVQARYVAHDAEHYGRVVPEGSFMLLLNASANRDEHQFPDPDRFDIHRRGSHLSFGQGLHFCLGSALARLEARVAFEEVLKRWPDWEVDYANAERAHTASVRGWARLPVFTG